jgi:hypothetical protein
MMVPYSRIYTVRLDLVTCTICFETTHYVHMLILLCRWGPNVVLAHPKLKHLPLGPKWNWRLAYHHAEDENKARLMAVFSKWAWDPAANFRKPKANLLFVQMSEGSSNNAVYSPSRGRRRVALAAARALLEHEPPPDITAFNPSQRACKNASEAFEHVLRVEEYLFGMQQYKFVLSPVGNGEDTHRTWEALLAGSIPIVESSVRDACMMTCRF